MTLLFALVVALCAGVIAVLFVTEWRGGDAFATVALGVALLSVLVVLVVVLRGGAA